MHRTLPLAAALLLACGACANSLVVEALRVSDEELRELRATFERSPGHLDARVDLARGLLGAESFEEILDLTGESAPDLHRVDIRVRVIRGLALEGMERWRAAEAVYLGLLEDPAALGVRGSVSARASLVRDRILQDDAKEAVRAERSLNATGLSSTSTAVLPFRVVGGGPEQEALGRAFAELLTTDLALVDRIVVVERIQVQALIDEMDLGASGLTSPETTARSGRLLGAGRLVRGSLTLASDEVTADAAVVAVAEGAAGPPRPVTRGGGAERLLRIEAELALDLLRELGIELSPAERSRILDKPAVRLEALIAFGQGLRSYELGGLQEAQTYFERAVEISPAFQMARVRSADVTRKREAGATALTSRAETAVERSRGIAKLQERVTPAQVRVPLVDALGADQATPRLQPVEILFRRPGS